MKLITVALAVTLGTLGCGDGKATARLRVDNVTTSGQGVQGAVDAPLVAAAAATQPSVFGVKLIAVYLAEDVSAGSQDNVGRTPMIYLNGACGGDITHCDLSPGTSPDGKPISRIVADYFDLALPSAEVNAALNAQGHPVAPGTYRYLRVEYCKYNAGGAYDTRWGTPDTGPVEFRRGDCVVTVPLVPALRLADGDSVTIALGYDLANTIQTGVFANGTSCTGADDARTCFTVPAFVPSVSR